MSEEIDAARARVAAEKGLNEAQAARLAGDTYEALTTDADALLRAFNPGPQHVHGAPVSEGAGGPLARGAARYAANAAAPRSMFSSGGGYRR